MRLFTAVAGACLFGWLAGCGSGDDAADAACSPSAQTGCQEGQVCEEVQGGEPACFAPIHVQGRVFDLADAAAVSGAHVVARDANGAAASGVAVSEASGVYSLRVPVARDSEGEPASTQYTLRVDAAGYLGFPVAPRSAVPVDVSMHDGGVVENAATDVGLIALEQTEGLGTIEGSVAAPRPGGALIVAAGVTGIAGHDGRFTVFNVPEGEREVRAYLVGYNLEAETVEVARGATTSGVDLGVLRAEAAAVSGKVSLVNPGDGDETSVILVVAETFVEAVARGEVPAGLRAEGVTGDFEISGVPDGDYFALAAFENDDLVRDPDVSQGGTDVVAVRVSGSDVVMDESFKVTGALAVTSPDAEEVVTGTPTFTWEDDSGEEHYSVAVYDAFGTRIWIEENVPSVSGSTEVSVDYAGPDLISGLVYQFRATSYKNGGAPISTTEDLRGVFVYE